MFKIAYLFNINITNLKRINDLLSEDLYPGQIIKINVDRNSDILNNPNIADNLADDEAELKKRS
jgi:LysM repeat protein